MIFFRLSTGFFLDRTCQTTVGAILADSHASVAV